MSIIVTARKRNLEQGNVFTPVSFCSQEGLPPEGGLPSGGSASSGGQPKESGGVCLQKGLFCIRVGRGLHPGGWVH